MDTVIPVIDGIGRCVVLLFIALDATGHFGLTAQRRRRTDYTAVRAVSHPSSEQMGVLGRRLQ